ncbi:hypothetical protein BSKO_04053 [Bryopsis sp. KO-2023]|nr:hypothetical protein BSKO_04053 [Bryopsis sp. KO-2023]
MGLDGGTYITRSDVLRGQSWRLSQADSSRSTRGGCVSSSDVYQEERQERETTRLVSWSTCSLSGEPLESDRIVADFLGNLYNKAAVLEFLLGKSGVFKDEQSKHRFTNISLRCGAQFGHLMRSTDVFAINGSRQAFAKTPESPEEMVFVCPITDLTCLRSQFSALATCGHVMSDRALKQITDNMCSVCSTPFKHESVIPINGTKEQVEALRSLLSSRRKKKDKGKKRKGGEGSGDATKGGEGSGDAPSPAKKKEKKA